MDNVLENAYLNKSRLLLKMGKTDEALEIVNKTLEDEPENKVALHEKGNILYLHGNTEEALELIEKALEVDANYMDAQITKVKILLGENRSAEAEKIAVSVLKQEPNDPASHFISAEVSKYKMDYAKSLKHYKKYLRSHPEDIEVFKKVVDIHLKIDDHKNALRLLNIRLAEDPGNFELLNFKLRLFGEKEVRKRGCRFGPAPSGALPPCTPGWLFP